MNHREKQVVRVERRRRKTEAGFMSSLFPEVESISINMVYSQKEIMQSLPRTVNFFPTSSALFRVDCLSKECIEGGFDFTGIINSMIGNRKITSSGELGCEGGPAVDHSAIVYEVAIQYV
jgi:hypothetical protein